MTDMNIYVPANVVDFYTFIHNLASFNFIPADKVFEWLGISTQNLDQDSIN
jgi:hypothetical protein